MSLMWIRSIVKSIDRQPHRELPNRKVERLFGAFIKCCWSCHRYALCFGTCDNWSWLLSVHSCNKREFTIQWIIRMRRWLNWNRWNQSQTTMSTGMHRVSKSSVHTYIDTYWTALINYWIRWLFYSIVYFIVSSFNLSSRCYDGIDCLQ
jgi:hypothetical protein